MSIPLEPQGPLGRRRIILRQTGPSEVGMDPRLAELLASARTDHVLQRGTGMYDPLIRSLVVHALDPKNTPYLDEILDAIKDLLLAMEIDPIRVDTSAGLRQALGNDLGNWALGPRGPMELE